MKKNFVFVPLICGSMLAAGLFLGSFLRADGSGFGFGNFSGNANERKKALAFEKIRAVLGFVQDNYVDTVDAERLTDRTLEAMLQALDPHSDYFTADQVQAMNEPLEGHFEGIGIEYNFIRDTLVVMAVIPGGPSEKANLLPGDRIVRAGSAWITGVNANEKFAKSVLRGKGGTKVDVQIVRQGIAAPIEKSITRGTVPIYSVQAAYLIDAETGYIKLARFSETSYREFTEAGAKLRKLGMRKMMLDLRGNGGGLLDAATSIADEFLPEGKMIVYTKGRSEGEIISKATKKGNFENMPLVILVDENSASASEILAGAIQDNDRGTIIGRRTYGKGLVQMEQPLRDGSAFRLTIARYYTPTGRCIQKPYDQGLAAYHAEENTRFTHGELLHADSIHFPDSLKFKTPGGKIVYGGGGIMPDIFVPLDTAGGSRYITDLFNADAIALWSLDYTHAHSAELQRYSISTFGESFSIKNEMISDLVQAGEKNKVKKDAAGLSRSQNLLKRYMKASIARNLWGDEGYYQVWNSEDPVIKAALIVLQEK
jgi:carboxyl-terminal processing protease